MTAKRQRILDFISEFTQVHGYPPSVREIGEAVGLKSPSTVHSHLQTLKQGGYLAKDDRKTRALKINSATPTMPYMSVPILGRVTAGMPILAVEEVEGYVPFDGNAGAEYFSLRVKGDSMVGAGIMDGDVIVVRKQDTALHGEIVVALLEDEATVKRLWKKNGKILLQPENELYSPIDGRDASILGKVAAVYRKY